MERGKTCFHQRTIPCMISFTLFTCTAPENSSGDRGGGGGGIGPTEGVLTTLSHQHIKQTLRGGGGWGLRTTIPKKTYIATCYLCPPPHCKGWETYCFPPYVCPWVCLFLKKSCLLYNLKKTLEVFQGIFIHL